MTIEKAANILSGFDVSGSLANVVVEGNGFINDTFIATFSEATGEKRVVLQRINHRVFSRPQDVMSNLRIISGHCLAEIQKDPMEHGRHWQVARVVPLKGGGDFWTDAEGNVWRCLTFIESAHAPDMVADASVAEECGKVLGHFLYLVSDIDVAQVVTTIPGFHVTGRYLQQYDQAVRNRSANGKSKPPDPDVRSLMEFVDARREFAGVLERAEQTGALRRRIIHGDPRIGNMLMDDETGKGVAMIDLDTCAPGLVQMDVGDAVRSICNPVGEDYEDIRDVAFREDVFAAFMTGFLNEMRNCLSMSDLSYMYPAIRLLPFELGLRFLTDHLKGNVYFKVKEEGQNLKRAQGQFRLCEIIENKEREIKRLLDACWNESGRIHE